MIAGEGPSLLSGIAVEDEIGSAHDLDRRWQEGVGYHHGSKVDLRLGRQARHRRTADMIDGKQAVTKQDRDLGADLGKQPRPARIVVDHLDSAHALPLDLFSASWAVTR
ncbi:hypothetical protein ACVIDN_004127 [Rhizobium brockwellii]